MGRMYGADADELDRLAGELGRLGDRLDRSRTTLGGQIHSAPWHGPGADDFRRRWNGEYRQIFGSAVMLLESGGDVLHRNADEQRRASEAGGGGAWNIAFPGSLASIGNVDPSFWERFLAGDFELELQTLLFIIENLDVALELLSNGVGGPLGVVSGVIQGILGIVDLINPEYEGALNLIESFGDVAGIVGAVGSIAAGAALTLVAVGAIATAPAWVPIAIGVAVVGGAVAFGVDWGLEWWDKGGGREWWYGSAAPTIDRAWDGTTGAIDRAWDSTTSAIDRTWDQAYEAGTAGYQAVSNAAGDVWDAGIDIVEDRIDDVQEFGSDVVSGAKRLIPGW